MCRQSQKSVIECLLIDQHQSTVLSCCYFLSPQYQRYTVYKKNQKHLKHTNTDETLRKQNKKQYDISPPVIDSANRINKYQPVIWLLPLISVHYILYIFHCWGTFGQKRSPSFPIKAAKCPVVLLILVVMGISQACIWLRVVFTMASATLQLKYDCCYLSFCIDN